ncbi:MAG: glycerol kinase GlpK [Clostridia bacterium]|nr:glycerol kinase GlpK [Clostridia bacterium]
MPEFILALDQGTTSSRAIIFDAFGQPIAQAQQEFPQHFPQPGWVEQDPNDIWESQLACARAALEKARLTAKDIAAIGITNQRETTILWDRKTGQPVHNAIVWQCRRTAPLCHELKSRGLEPIVQERTGLVIDAYFSGTKIQWLLQTYPEIRKRAEKGEIAFGTVDSWLVYKLTGGRLHLTDYTNASRTLLFNIHDLKWDELLLEELGVPAEILPEVRLSSQLYGETDPHWLGGPIPIGGIAGDQQAALFGQGCFNSGQAKNTYGTGCFLLMNTGSQAVNSRHGLITTVAWGIPNGQARPRIVYALEGSIFVAGAAIQWLRDSLGLLETAAASETLAASVPDNGGVYLVPAFTGLGAPYWDMEARGTIVGLTRGSTRAHLARAALEAIAYQTRDVLEAMVADAGTPLNILKADGGATANNFLMQFQADILGVPVQRAAIGETTALGAAYLAGLASGLWTLSTLPGTRAGSEGYFVPAMDAISREALYQRWKQAVARSRQWAS